MVAQGFHCAAWDIDYNSGCDILKVDNLQRLLRFCTGKHVVLVWMGMPCQSWSRARRWDGGPEPLRDDDGSLYGRPGLFTKDLDKVFEGNLLLCWTYLLCQLCFHLHCAFVVENPFTSRCWLTSHFKHLISSGAVLHRVDFCQYQVPWRKSTGLLCFNVSQLPSILRTCATVRGRCSATHKRRLILSGKDANDVWWTMRAQPYPKALCSELASFFASTLV